MTSEETGGQKDLCFYHYATCRGTPIHNAHMPIVSISYSSYNILILHDPSSLQHSQVSKMLLCRSFLTYRVIHFTLPNTYLRL